MTNNIQTLSINNFKSIKNLEIGCTRVNVFIGEPNVGKSNILEALSLFCAPYVDGASTRVAFRDLIRFEKLSNLFYDQDRKNTISVETNIGSCALRYHMNSINSYDFTVMSTFDEVKGLLNIGGSTGEVEHAFREYVKLNTKVLMERSTKPFYSPIGHNGAFDLHSISLQYETPFKRYIFQSLTDHPNHFPLFLRVPHGDNLYHILESTPKLYEECTKFFSKFNLDLLIDTESNKLDVQKRVGSRVYKIPYSLAADTLQRIIFHFAAIETNSNSILIFEEPEAHSFPKYISMFADKVIANENNQFFIATHSPYLLTPFIEQCNPDDLSIFVCRYEDYETRVHKLTRSEIANIMETDIDLFFNVSAFQK